MSEEIKDDMFDEPFPTEEQVRYAKQILYYGDSQPFAITLFNHILHLEKQLLEAKRRGEERGFEAGMESMFIDAKWRTLSDWRASEEYKEGK